jgi:hypothetical protein
MRQRNAETRAYLTTPAVAKLLANRQRYSGTDATLWEGNLQPTPRKPCLPTCSCLGIGPP